VDGNHSTIYTSADIFAHPSVQLTRGGLILIGLLSGGDYHPAGLPRCGPGLAHGLAKSGLGDELLEAAQSLTRAELSEFLTTWRETLRNELRTNSRKHLGSKKPSLAKAISDSFPDIDVLLSYTNPIISATDAGARLTHTPPEWNREPDLAKLAHVCELHFEWGLKDIIIKRFRTVLWPSIVLRTLRRSALEADAKAVARSTSSAVRERESPRDAPGTPSKILARHFSSMALEADSGEDDSSRGDLIVKIHGSRTHAYTDGLLEYRLEISPVQLVQLASAGIQGLRKPADTTYDVLPSESEDSGEVDDEDGHAGTGRKKKRRGGGPPPEPESHLRVWMPACMVKCVLPDLVSKYETALEAKRAKKSKPKVPRGTAKASVAKGKGKTALASRKTVQAPSRPTDEEYFDLDVSSSGESDGRASPPPSVNHSRPLPTTSSRDTPLPQSHPKKPNDAIVHAVDDVFVSHGTLDPTGVVRQHTQLTQDSLQRVSEAISVCDGDSDVPGPSGTRTHHHLSSPSKVLQRLDQNLKILNVGVDLASKARQPPIPLAAPPSSSLSPRIALRPFPIAFEEEEKEEEASSDDGSEVPSERPTSNNRQDQYTMQHAAAPATPPGAYSPPHLLRPERPLSAVGLLARKDEEEEESSDDPDTVPADLPVFHPLSSSGSPRGQRRSRTSGNPQSDPPPVHRHDTTFDVLNHNQYPRQQQQQPSSSPPSSPSKTVRSSAREDELLPLDHWRRQRRRRVSKGSSSSVISISTDSDASDNGDNSLPTTLTQAPLLIARSRSAVSQRLATTSHYRKQKNIEHEVIDLT
jgi:hypothetical protein